MREELKIYDVIKAGGIGIKWMLIAQSKADFYITGTKRLKLWDTCAPAAILKAAGGIVASLFHKPLLYTENFQHGVPMYTANINCKKWITNNLDPAIKRWQNSLHIKK